MAQYVYTMRRVSKTVPPKRTILKNISLNFFLTVMRRFGSDGTSQTNGETSEEG